ncbi:MAG: PIN domain-containing protein [Candidatus Hydrothermarchaeales archaeon]
MLAEVSKTFGIKTNNVISYIKKNPAVVSKLKILWGEMGLIRDSGLKLMSIGKLFPEFVETSRKFNLLATDAMIVEVMKKNNIENIATNDSDFERVDFLKVWKP